MGMWPASHACGLENGKKSGVFKKRKYEARFYLQRYSVGQEGCVFQSAHFSDGQFPPQENYLTGMKFSLIWKRRLNGCERNVRREAVTRL